VDQVQGREVGDLEREITVVRAEFSLFLVE
jgi:hypothetical protein